MHKSIIVLNYPNSIVQNIRAVYRQSSHEVHTEVILCFSLPATIIWKNGRHKEPELNRPEVLTLLITEDVSEWPKHSLINLELNSDVLIATPRESVTASCAVCQTLSALCLDFHHIFTESIQICCRYFAHVLVLHLWEPVIWSLAKILSKYKAFSVVWRLFMWLCYTK